MSPDRWDRWAAWSILACTACTVGFFVLIVTYALAHLL